jgi:putative ABC transport system ATP-binding protein
MTASLSPAIDATDLRFAYPNGAPVLDIGAFCLEQGERVFLRGASGAGKSTLLGLVSGILPMQSGSLKILGEDVAKLNAARRDEMRARDFGVIFQMFNLVPYLSVTENVTLPLQFSKTRRARISGDAGGEAQRLLSRLGLTDEILIRRRVSDLSVGQQQRVAAARALIGSPRLILADEPTSALDSEARNRFIELLSEETRRANAALLFVSHDASLAGLFDRALDLGSLNRAGQSA